MKMNKILLAILAMGTTAGVAQAQVNLVNTDGSELSVYGILDAGVVQMTNAGNISPNFVTGAVPTGTKNNGGTVRGMMNGGESATRWGIMGSEDLGGGDKAFFKLETGFSIANGTIANSGLTSGNTTAHTMAADTSLEGQLFGRAAYVGLSDKDLGAVSFGRMNNLQLDIIAVTAGGYDPVNAQMFSPINFSGFYGGGGQTDNARVDQAVKYSKQIGNFNVNALYAFGGVAGSSTARSNEQLNVGYETDTFGVQAAAMQAKDTTAILPPAGLTYGQVNVQFVNLTSYMLTGRYKVTEPLTLKAGIERVEFNAPSNYGADQGLGTIYGYQIVGQSPFAGPQKNENVYWLGANYDLSSKTKISVGYYDVEMPSGTGNGTGVGASTTTTSGSDKYTSAMIEYSLSKKTNVYAAFMLDKKSGSLAFGTGYPTTFNTYGAGLRVKF
jgi:predicted porin